MIQKIAKRDGRLVPFDPTKIERAIRKAGLETGEYEPAEAARLAHITQDRLPHDKAPGVELIQDTVERTLIDEGYVDTARAYIAYRERRAQARRDLENSVDVNKSINEYIGRSDWRVNANANQGYNLGGLILNASGKMMANYWLGHIYPAAVGEAHRNGDIHIHDLDILGGYCFTGDTRVWTLDGKNPTFKELVREGADETWVYAYDVDKDEVVPAKAVMPRITRHVDELVEVTLQTGETFRCTPDHPIMMRDGSYKKACELKQSDSLMPLNATQNGRYTMIRNAWHDMQGKAYVHRWVAGFMKGRKLERDEVVHHINGDKHDNRPENLRVMDDAEHRAQELRSTMATDKWQTANNKRLVAYNKSADKRQAISKIAKNRTRDDHGRFTYMAEKDPSGVEYNHSVYTCHTVKLDEPIPVYDLTVPGYSNFAIYGPNVFVHNCAGWSLRTLLREGFNGVANKIESAPPKHLSSALGQMVNFLGTLQNEWAGAQAFSSADTYLAPYIRVDNLTQKEVEQCMQNFVFSMNVPSRWGGQCPFTNLTFDLVCPDDLRDVHPEVGGVMQDFTYGELQREMDMINRAFVRVMCAGDLHGRVFTFPIPTYNITDDFDWDSPITDEIFEMTAKYGLPYFQNFLKSDMDPHMVRSMCPLNGDTKVLVRADYGSPWRVETIDDLYREGDDGKQHYVMLNGEMHKARIHAYDGLRFVRVGTANGHYVTMSTNHTNRVLRLGEDGSHTVTDVPTSEMRVGDYLPFNTHESHGVGFDEKTGYLIGAYLCTGEVDDDTVTLSVNSMVRPAHSSFVESYLKKQFAANVDSRPAMPIGNTPFSKLTVKSPILRTLLEEFVDGEGDDKRLDARVVGLSAEARKSILRAMMDSTGALKSDTVYTKSRACADSVCLLLASLGMTSKVTVDPRPDIQPVYEVTFHSPKTLDEGGDYITTDDAVWYKVASMEPVDTGTDVGYCFEVDGPEPLFMLPSGLITHNCRLRLDVSELLKRGNGLFGSAEQTGSIGVVTVNMARLGYEHAGDPEALYAQLDHLLNLAKVSLELKRKTVTELMERGLYPFTARYLGTFRNHFSTIGVNGINELIRNYTHDAHDITDDTGHLMAAELLDHIRDKMVEFQTETGHMYNLEATPGEGACYRFAREDIKRHADIIHAGTDERPYYTNSSQLPVNFTSDPFLALEMQQDLQAKYTGGTVLHLYLGERVSSPKAAKSLVRKSLSNFSEPYITLTPTFSVCPRHGYIAGEHKWCPKCDEELKAAHSHQQH